MLVPQNVECDSTFFYEARMIARLNENRRTIFRGISRSFEETEVKSNFLRENSRALEGSKLRVDFWIEKAFLFLPTTA